MEFPKEYDFDEILIQPKYSTIQSRKEVDLEREFLFQNSIYSEHPSNEIRWKGIPIIAANMDTTGTFEVYQVLSKYKMLTALHKHYTVEDYKNAVIHNNTFLNPDYFMISTGITDENLKNLQQIMDYTNCKWICIDVANGYMEVLLKFCKKVRKLYPNKIIMAGNVVCQDMTIRLLQAGIDLVKVGIGSGSACLTRKQTGIGRKQFSAILDCSQIHETRPCKYIVSDGGIKEPADAAKAFAAGADFVMIGGMFAGHDENPGEIIDTWDGQFKQFYGMSSKHAMDKYYGGMDRHRSSEGAVIKVPYKGALEDTVLNLLGGLRSTCSYVGARIIEELPFYATFRT